MKRLILSLTILLTLACTACNSATTQAPEEPSGPRIIINQEKTYPATEEDWAAKHGDVVSDGSGNSYRIVDEVEVPEGVVPCKVGCDSM